MHVDLTTLYLLAIGTLFASSAMTLWECRAHPQRATQLKLLASAYATLGIGCAAATFRHDLPGAIGSALSNLVIVAGYLLILCGVGSLSGRRYRKTSIATLAALALTWAIVGAHRQETMWNFWSAIPIAFVSGMTALALRQADGMEGFQSRHIAMLVALTHALFYGFRAFVLPWWASRSGFHLLLAAGEITMYEGVLYSVVLPMTLLKMIREEAHGQLLQEARTDYLTGLRSRRCFFEEGAKALRNCGATGPASLLAFDLDHFKAINDRYGHETGDEVLKSFAEIARGALGADAIVARIGGEEFAALLPGHDSEYARQLGERVVRRFGAEGAHRAGIVGMAVTVSVGLSQRGAEKPVLAELLAAADRALYSAKSLGGNRLELAQTAARRAAA